MFQRVLTSKIVESAKKMPVVTVTGPRQSGKTTLVRASFPDHAYVSLETPDDRAEARQDPRGFLKRLGTRAILDEVQKAPDLLSYIQTLVDENNDAGQYILTGSQNLLLMETISQTLAGRTSLFKLLPLSIAELFDRPPLDPSTLASAVPGPTAPAPARGVWETVWAGFYPRIHDKALPPTEWLADYYRTYVERDLRDILKVMNLDAFDRFVRLSAARTGQELNSNSLASDAGISQPTAREWLTALQVGFLVAVFPSHDVNYSRRLRKRPRLHFLDSGLVCYLLGITDPRQLERHPLRGAIFESFVAAELCKAFESSAREPPLFFWRDATGHEIDILVDLGSRLVPVDVKSGTTVASDYLDGLKWWTGLKGNPNTGGVLVYGGNEARSREGFEIRPWFLQ